MQAPSATKSGMLRRWGEGGGRYARSLLWLVRRGLAIAPVRVVLIVLTNAFGVLTAAGSYGLILKYARCMQSGDALVIRGVTLAQPGQWQGVFLVAGGTIALGLSSAGAIYAAQALILSIARAFETFCRSLLLGALGPNPTRRWSAMLGDPRVTPVVVRMMNVGARFCAFSLRFALQGVLPLLTLLAASAFMLWQAPLLTLLLVPFALAYLPVLFLINRAIARRYQLYQGHYGVAALQIRRQVEAMLHTNSPSTEEHFTGRELLDGEAHATGQRGFYRHMLFGETLQLANSGFFILCMIFLFLYFAGPWKVAGGSWAELIAVLIALRFVWKGVRQTTAVLGGISRYHPELHRFVTFVEASRPAVVDQAAEDIELPAEITPSSPGEFSGGRAVPIAPSRPIGVVIDGPPRRDTAAEAANVLAGGDVRGEQCAMHLRSRYRNWLTPEQNALGPAADSHEARKELRDLLEQLSLDDEVSAGDDPSSTEPTSPEVRYALLAAHSFLGDAKWVFVSADEFRGLGADFRKTLLRQWAARAKAVFLLTDTPGSLLEDAQLADDLTGVAVVAGKRLVGCGGTDWLGEHRGRVEEITAGEHRLPPTRREENDLLELEMI
ncbi:MAG: hypothetical protein ACOCZU_05800 [Planctomycetota bacterium]